GGSLNDLSALTRLPFDRRIEEFFMYLGGRRGTEAVGESREPGVWEVFRYDEAVQVLGDHRTFSSDMNHFIPEEQRQLARAARGNFVGIDPPDHTQLRGLVSQAFSPRVTAALEPRIGRLAEQLLDDIVAERGDKASCDLVGEFAGPLSAIVIAELFGIPESDHTMIAEWAKALLGSRPAGELSIADEAAMQNTADLVRRAGEYLVHHITERRARPQDDLTSRLATTEVDGKRLDDEEIVGVIGMFLIAGYLPASVLTANTVMALDEHPAALAEVRSDPALLPGAIEEVLRWRPPLVRDQRLTTRDADLGGRTVPAGSMVCVWLASAHRDPFRFENPDLFDIHRNAGRHLAFGKGIHYCLGAPLARLEARIAVETLLRRFERIEIPRDESVEFHESIGVLGPVRLPTTLFARR
uniref:Cytochrome P450 113A1 n=1 Tax=Streptomyces filamentosus NRRL 15998 TaxID=457431 RepID=UPI001D05C256|nr:Chain A, Cytochrome P450 113A1 [Streptomyces filamentosus NRRL 15998]7AYX_B Chain B, Cytochrome P450 113A1 [Streptomyces filamentosus NRRL 15998]